MFKNYSVFKNSWILLMLLISSFSFAQTNTWDGSSNGNWNTAANWSLNRVPRTTDDVIIPNSATQPTISTAAAVCSNLTINNGATLTVGGQNLTVGGATSISGMINFNSTVGAEIFTGLVTINNSGYWKNTANEAINFRGGITNNGTFSAGTGVQSFTNNSQSLSGDFIIPNVTVTGNAVILTNNNNLTVSAALTGTGRLTNAANAVLNIGGTSGITTLTATAVGNTVNYNGSDQDVKGTTYSNLTISGNGIKTLNAITTINNNLLISSNNTLLNNDFQIIGNTSGLFTLQNKAILQLGGNTVNSAVNATTFPANFTNNHIDLQTGSKVLYNFSSSKGGFQVISTVPTYYNLECQYPGTKQAAGGILNINGDFDTASPLDLNTNDPTINLKGDFNLLAVPAPVSLTGGVFSIAGDFNNTLTSGGSLASGNGTVLFNGIGAQSIKGGLSVTTSFFNVTVNKSSGTLSLTNSNQAIASNLTVTAGIVDLSTYNLNRLSSGGILTVSNDANLRIGGTNNYPANFTNNTFGATSTVEYYANANQTVSPRNYGNLIFSGSGIKSTSNTTSVASNLYITNGVKANVAAGTNINAGSLTLGVYKKINGTWGSTSSAATYKDDNYFAGTNGTVTVSTDTRPTPVFSNLTASQSICFGTPTTTLSGTVSGGGVYPLENETVAVTVNGITQNATISGDAGAFTVNFNTATLPSSGTPYIITYAFATTTNVNFKAVTDKSTTLTVNPIPATPTVTTTVATCSALGTATITNYLAANTYTFSPAGPSAGAGGVISNLTAGTSYTVTATNGSCTSLVSASFTVAAKLLTPATPTVATTVATCSTQGMATITNYLPANTYTFSPAGPSADAGGVISNLTAGTSYTVTATNGSCTSLVSASFTVAAKLLTPATPTVTTTVATCSAQGTATITNYLAANTYTFSPAGPSAGAGGVISNLTALTNYTVIASNGSCISPASSSFTIAAKLPTPATPTVTTTVATCSAPGTATITNYLAANTYTFSPAGPSAGAGGVISNLTAGTSYTVTAKNGSCTSLASASFTVANQLPEITASVSIAASPGTTICAGTSVTFTATPTNGGTIPGYQWKVNGTDVLGETASTFTITTLANNDKVTVVMTSNASPCLIGSPATSNDLTMNVNPLPTTVTVSGNGQVCSGVDAVFTIAGTPGTIVTYNINGGSNTNIVLPGTGSVEVTVSGATANQILNVVSVSNGTCVNYTTSATTVIVGAVSTWSGGAWNNGRPDNNGLGAVIAGNYKTASGNIRACNCTVNNGATLTISGNTEMVVLNNIDNQGTIIVQSDGNLNQINDDAVNTGSIIVRREHTLSTKRKEYNFLSSPVKNQNMKLIFGNNPGNIPFVTILKESTNAFVNAAASDWSKSARGFAVKEPIETYSGVIAEYNGPANNGKIAIDVTKSAPNRGWNIIGNPYPSNIDLKKLYMDNSTVITAEFRFWDNAVNATYTQYGGSYSGYSYAVYNAATSTNGFGNPAPGNDTGNNGEGNGSGTGTGERVPFRIVNVSQAFMVRATDTPGPVNYKNAYRSTSNDNTTFFGKSSGVPEASYRIKLITPSKLALTQGVVYFEGGNNEFGIEDSKHPAPSSSDAFYSLVGDEKVVINGRSVFNTNDVIKLGTQNYVAGLYKIKAIDQMGVFANGQQPIYIKDNLLNVITDISANAYEFTSVSGGFTNRFEIVYESEKVLITDGTVKVNVEIYRDGQDFVIKSSVKKINAFDLYDMSGRIILSQKTNEKEVRFNASKLVDGNYILKANLEGGGNIVKKIRK